MLDDYYPYEIIQPIRIGDTVEITYGPYTDAMGQVISYDTERPGYFVALGNGELVRADVEHVIVVRH